MNMNEIGFLGKKDESSTVINCIAESSTTVYKNCNLQNCILGNSVSIGDFSRIYDSRFMEHVFIERYNYIKDSIIGRYTYTGKNTVIQNATVGKFCSISWNVTIGAGEHDYSRITNHAFLYDKSFNLLPKAFTPYDIWDGNCTIGNDVWIAANACIKRNDSIGNGAVVGAGAVVSHDVEPYTIVVGVPAKAIKKRFDDNTINRLERLRWWDLPTEVIKKHFTLFDSTYPFYDVINQIEQLCNKYL